jgi:3-hydroxyacyl-[acyl-carrier-protein] dehydratase
MILEALAQATGILAFVSGRISSTSQSLYYFVGIDHARFKKPVGPGDQLLLHVTLTRSLRGMFKFAGEARVAGDVVAYADLMTAAREFPS